MTNYLVDTNLLVRVADQTSSSHTEAVSAIGALVVGGHNLHLTAQNLIEFWAVATRPSTANGLNWTATQAEQYVQQLRQDFAFLPDAPAVFTHWLYLVTAYQVSGKQVHDSRLVAVMQTYGITHLLTYNLADFRYFPGIVVVDPASLA